MDIYRTCCFSDALALAVRRSGVRWGFSDLGDGVAAAGRLGYRGLLDARYGKPSHCVAHSAPPYEVPLAVRGGEQHGFDVRGGRGPVSRCVANADYSMLGHRFLQGGT